MEDKKYISFCEFIKTVEALRAENGCPWDKVQTHMTLRDCMVEEAFELVDAIECDNSDKICDECGDVILQVAMHSQIASEEGRFDISDVFDAITAKLKRRHPHVFGTIDVSSVDEVITNWDEIKKKESAHKDRKTIVDTIPRHLPALAAATKLVSKARKAGIEMRSREDMVASIKNDAAALADATKSGENTKMLIGKLLYEIAAVGKDEGIAASEYFNLIVEASGIK